MLRALASGSVVPTAADKAADVRQGCLWCVALMVKTLLHRLWSSFNKKFNCRSWCCYELPRVSSVAALGRRGKRFAVT